jgi:hypothetical protein
MRFSPALRLIAGIAAGTALAATAAACVPATTLPDDCSAPSVQREAVLSADALDPATLEVCRGQHVTIAVDSQADGELHFHGLDQQVPEQEVTAGATLTVEFDADASGNFPIELHSPDGSSETEVGTLVVNEP